MTSWTKPTSRVVALLVLCLCVSVGLRCFGLTHKAYGNDEATTSLRVAGATLADYRGLFDARPQTVGALRRYQEMVPTASASRVVASLQTEDPQHPPLYYLAEYGWVHFDHGVAGHRRLSIVFGVLACIAFAWMLWEITEAWPVVVAGGACIAVSPFFVMYSQQAREYSLWAFWTCASTALLARMMLRPQGNKTRRVRLLEIVAYTVTVMLGAFTALLFVGVIIAHAVFLALYVRRPRAPGALADLFSASVFSLGVWLPSVLHNQSAVTNNYFLAAAVPAKIFVAKWLENCAVLVADCGLLPAGFAPRGVVLAGAALMVLGLCALLGLGIVALRTLRRDARTLVAGLIAAPALLLLVPDLIHHESRSTAARYLVPTWLGLEALLAIGLGCLWVRRPVTAWFIGGALVLAGTGSAFARDAVPAWWTDWSAYSVVAQTRAIAALPAPAQLAYIEHAGNWDFSVMELVDELPAVTELTLYGNPRVFLRRQSRAVNVIDLDRDAQAALLQAGWSVIANPLNEPSVIGPALLGRHPANDDSLPYPIGIWLCTPPQRNQ